MSYREEAPGQNQDHGEIDWERHSVSPDELESGRSGSAPATRPQISSRKCMGWIQHVAPQTTQPSHVCNEKASICPASGSTYYHFYCYFSFLNDWVRIFQDFVTNNILKINVLSNATAAMFLYIWPEQKNWLPAKSHTKGHLPLSIGPHKSSETTSW